MSSAGTVVAGDTCILQGISALKRPHNLQNDNQHTQSINNTFIIKLSTCNNFVLILSDLLLLGTSRIHAVPPKANQSTIQPLEATGTVLLVQTGFEIQHCILIRSQETNLLYLSHRGWKVCTQCIYLIALFCLSLSVFTPPTIRESLKKSTEFKWDK